MTPRWTVAIVVLLAVAGVVTPTLAMSPVDERADREANPFEPLSGAETNETMGSQISAFMESSSTAADSSIETGMWIARFNATGMNRTEMVERRANALQNRLQALERELEKHNASGDVDLSDPGEARQIASLNARVDALNATIERTRTVANASGVNTTQLDRLRENASKLHGQEVARIARNLTTVGPPENRGPPGEGPPGQSDGDTRGPPTDDTPGQADNKTQGPPANQSPGQNENDTRGGPTDDTPGQADNKTQGPSTGQAPDQGSDRTQGPSEERSDNTNETADSDADSPKVGNDTSEEPSTGQPDSSSPSAEQPSERPNN
ncbi:ICP22 family protein [Halapricum hydrolyticum]|uniref:Uncharacterized protein n=1 Tax=Halapricum hydrolyticum TaxID=2979991 RepID=A0AAE3IB88_9EURY|nr:hypothetical protein [Halapricum hydrolyticum]MCU4719140.1 hypothetical protein [Halapricum hydrolyticum]MCU4727330.1 hypothetical protein [Halapricum hydrolyticum]